MGNENDRLAKFSSTIANFNCLIVFDDKFAFSFKEHSLFASHFQICYWILEILQKYEKKTREAPKTPRQNRQIRKYINNCFSSPEDRLFISQKRASDIMAGAADFKQLKFEQEEKKAEVEASKIARELIGHFPRRG